jgi:hypothetical protein
MGRRRRLVPVTMTTISITLETLEIISRFKSKRENQDDFIKRIFTEWQDLKEYTLDMDQVLRLKDKQIQSLQKEIHDIKLNKTNPFLV